MQLIIARDIAKAPELTNLLKQCTKTVLGAGAWECVEYVRLWKPCGPSEGTRWQTDRFIPVESKYWSWTNQPYTPMACNRAGGNVRGVENHGIRALSHRLRK